MYVEIIGKKRLCVNIIGNEKPEKLQGIAEKAVKRRLYSVKISQRFKVFQGCFVHLCLFNLILWSRTGKLSHKTI